MRWFRLPILSALMPALINGIIVGFDIDFFVVNQGFFNLYDFLFVGGCVALGELGVLLVLGLDELPDPEFHFCHNPLFFRFIF